MLNTPFLPNNKHPLDRGGATESLLNNFVAPNSLRAYCVDFEQFETWCIGVAQTALPATTSTIIGYVEYLIESPETYKADTIKRKIYAISSVHKIADLPTPVTAKVRKMLGALQRKHSGEQQQAVPALSDYMAQAIRLIDPDTNKGKRDQAVLLLGFVGCFRRSELAAIKIADIDFSPKGATIIIWGSKTDHTGGGMVKAIPYSSHPELCPVRALQSWIAAAQLTEQHHLFVSIAKGDHIKPNSPCDAEGKMINRIIKTHLGNKYSGHSLRVGFAVQAYENGASGLHIQQQGGWRTDTMVKRYVRKSDIWRENAAFKLGL